MTEQELNRKLAEWAGFEFNDDWADDRPYKSPDGVILHSWKDFTQSLDACFKWLVPMLTKEFIELEIHLDYLVKHRGWNVSLFDGFYNVDEPKHNLACAFANEPALALCKAIEKLIDSEAENDRNKS